ncbi:MAG: DNA polymerase I, partial [Acetobacteraceae bacterium]|nr:DNA polymerase I [Acetobacteraceae bacterium]
MADLAVAEPEALAPAGEKLHLILIDGSGFIFRAFHALPPMNRSDGTPVNAVFGFTNMLARLLQSHEGTHIAVVFDAGRTTFRNELYANYKAQRPEPPSELVPQFALVRDATAAFGVKVIELPTWEADDLIASYACAATASGFRTTIVSSDKDLMQLIDEHVTMLDPIKQKPIGADEVMAKFGVPPAKVVEVQALMGDSVDNVPGVPGVGPKNAAQLIVEYGDVEGVIAAIETMKPSKRRDLLREHTENIRVSRKLVELCRDCPVPIPLEELRAREPDKPTLARWLLAMGFRSTATRLGLMAEAAEPSPEPQQLEAAPEQPPFGPYETVTSLARLQEWIAEARSAGAIGLDTETDGLDPTRATLLGIGLATGPNRACYIPLRHRLPSGAEQGSLEGSAPAPALVQLEPETAFEALRLLLTDPSVLKVMHNGKPDLIALARAGLTVSPIDDTMVMSYAMGAGAHGHGLDELALRDLGHKPMTFDSVTGTGRARIPFAEVPLDRATA